MNHVLNGYLIKEIVSLASEMVLQCCFAALYPAFGNLRGGKSNQSNAVGNSPTFLFLETPNREPARPVACALAERSTAEAHDTGARTTGRH